MNGHRQHVARFLPVKVSTDLIGSCSPVEDQSCILDYRNRQGSCWREEAALFTGGCMKEEHFVTTPRYNGNFEATAGCKL